jgi:hypothetical protein
VKYQAIKTLSFMLLLAALPAPAARAQQRQNIGGTWKMNPAKSKFELGAPQALTIDLDQQGTAVKESLRIVGPEGERVVKFNYTLDGKEQVNKVESGEVKITARWEGDSLLFELKTDQGYSYRRKIMISEDGKTMTINLEELFATGTRKDTIVLEKQ